MTKKDNKDYKPLNANKKLTPVDNDKNTKIDDKVFEDKDKVEKKVEEKMKEDVKDTKKEIKDDAEKVKEDVKKETEKVKEKEEKAKKAVDKEAEKLEDDVAITKDTKLEDIQPKKRFGWGAVLIAAILGLGFGLAGGIASFHGGSPVLNVDGHTYRTNDVVTSLANNSTATSAYRSIIMKDALNDKYGSDAINKKVNTQFAELQSKYKGTKWKQFLAANNFQSDADVKNALRSNIEMQKYLNSKVSDADVKQTYKDFIPMQGIAYKICKSKADAQKQVDEYNKNATKDGYKDWSKKNAPQTMTMSSINNTFSKDEFKELAGGKQYEAHVLKVKGQDQYVMVVLTDKKAKGSYDEEKAQIRELLETKLTTNQAKFGKQFVKDLNIKGQDEFGKNVVNSFTTPTNSMQ